MVGFPRFQLAGLLSSGSGADLRLRALLGGLRHSPLDPKSEGLERHGDSRDNMGISGSRVMGDKREKYGM